MPPRHYEGMLHSLPLPPAGGRRPRLKPRHGTPPSTQRARYGPCSLDPARLAMLGESPRAVHHPHRLARPAKAGLQGLPRGVIMGLGIACNVKWWQCAQRVVGPW